MNKTIDVLKVRVGLSDKIPDPSDIDTTGKWYFLDHISSGLVHFDHTKGKFEGLLADTWVSHPSGTHTFTLRADAKFHDGTPITAYDLTTDDHFNEKAMELSHQLNFAILPKSLLRSFKQPESFQDLS